MKIRSIPRNPGKRRDSIIASRVPLLRPDAAQEEAPFGRPPVTPEEVRDKADTLGALSSRLGGPLSDLQYEQQDEQREGNVQPRQMLKCHVVWRGI